MKKKVLFILHMPPPVHGAAMVGKYLRESQEINEAFETDYINLTTAVNIEKLGKPSRGTFTLLFKIQLQVLKALLKKRYDLCYVSLNSKGSGYYKDFLVVLILKVFRKKIIYHFHNKGIATIQHRKLNDLLYRFTFKNTKSILLSELLFTDIAKYVNKKNTFFCANGIPDSNNPKTFEQNQVSSQKACQLLFFSNMMVQKGVYDLVAACKILQEKGHTFHCHFVGAWSDISEAEMNRKIIQEGLSDLISFHGKKIGAEKTEIFNSADIFILPSHNECFPLVNLEAMQFSLPVITTTVGGIPDMVIDGETGFLIPPKDPLALAEKLDQLIRDPEMRTRMGLAGRKLYEASFTMNTFEVKMKNILETAIEGN